MTMPSIPEDVLQALNIAGGKHRDDLPWTLRSDAERDGVDPDSLSRCQATGIDMVLTHNEPWWRILVQGNAVLAEGRLRDAGFDNASAGSPTQVWLRLATEAEVTAYCGENKDGEGNNCP